MLANLTFKNREVRHLEHLVELMNLLLCMLNLHDAFTVKFALKLIVKTCTHDMHAVQSAQPPSCACMKGAGFKISRLHVAIDKSTVDSEIYCSSM